MTTAHTERRHCRVCNLELPTSAVEALCDDHADGQETATSTPQPDRPMRVMHNGLISKRNGGLEEMIHA
ncbi:hypothetical protein A5761_15095 [Mycolicibacterium setense]|uniref:hypothetical protein n=1 Tax=Mycolicibacterium setense TaxID=431269 RepID=UPI0007E99967|nr:hypothetical protein [Mycolicibacterium setense]OBB15066.1 hypothetical protein A5761_15095 [Mycolicibacterium setense]